MDVAALFRRRLRKLILAKYRSLDRFYLETDFSFANYAPNVLWRRRPKEVHRPIPIATFREYEKIANLNLESIGQLGERIQRRTALASQDFRQVPLRDLSKKKAGEPDGR